LVEIYNSGPNAVDVTGWAIDDAVTITTTAFRARLPEDFDPACSTNPILQPGEFRVVHMYQPSGAVLNNTGDDVYLVTNSLHAARERRAVGDLPRRARRGAGVGVHPEWHDLVRVAYDGDDVRQQRWPCG
jgi:hypothetical protein